MTPPGGEPLDTVPVVYNEPDIPEYVERTIMSPPGEPLSLNNRNDSYDIFNIVFNAYNLIQTRDQMFHKFIDREDAIRMIKINNKCRCCIRHSINRPCHIDDDLYETGNNYWISNEDLHNGITNNQCRCTCRHENRWIIRMYHDDPEL